MVISFKPSGELLATKTFSDTSKNYRMVDYTGGVPPGSDLSLPGGGNAAQGIIVHYAVTPSPGNQVVTWTLAQYEDGSSSSLRFAVKVFLVKTGTPPAEETGSNNTVKYK